VPDIECAGRRGVFPEAEVDPVINIANYITVQGAPLRSPQVQHPSHSAPTAGDRNPCVRSVFCLRSCSSIVGSEVHTFDREADMLAAWRDFVVEVRL
jgi:DNA polymerase delta subunit 1